VIALRLLKDGAVVRETVFRTLPVTLGRGEDCDFPIFDGSVSRRHAVLEREPAGALVLRDLGSRNGLHVGPKRVPSVPVAALVQCLVGTVELELEPLREGDTQEIRLHDWHNLERRRGARAYLRALALGTVGWLAAWATEPSFWSPWEKGRSVSLLSQALAALVGLPLLAVVLLVLLKAFGRKLRVADALETLARLLWLAPLANVLTFIAYYPLSSSAFDTLRGLLLLAALAWGAGALAAIRRPGPSRLFRAAWAAVVVVLALGVGVVAGLSHDKTGEPELDFHVQMPIGSYAGRSESLDAYFTRLSEAAQQAAAEAAAERGQRND
jgi:FHA domain-containing protein